MRPAIRIEMFLFVAALSMLPIVAQTDQIAATPAPEPSTAHPESPQIGDPVQVVEAPAGPPKVDDRIPIFSPGEIRSSGRYRLVRNVQSELGPAIAIRASGVDLDLNGFAVVSTFGSGIEVANSSDLRIHNGSVSSSFLNVEVAIRLENVSRAILEQLSFSGFMEIRNGRQIEIDRVRGRGIQDSAPTLTVSGTDRLTVRHSRFSEGLGSLIEGTGLIITDNFFAGSTRALSISGTSGHVRRNVVEGGSFGLELNDAAIGFIVTDNTVRGDTVALGVTGLPTSSYANRIEGNIVLGSAEFGMSVGGARNIVRDNLISGATDVGLTIGGTGNIYGGNVARGNASDFAIFGEGHASEGDNYLPDRQ